MDKIGLRGLQHGFPQFAEEDHAADRDQADDQSGHESDREQGMVLPSAPCRGFLRDRFRQ